MEAVAPVAAATSAEFFGGGVGGVSNSSSSVMSAHEVPTGQCTVPTSASMLNCSLGRKGAGSRWPPCRSASRRPPCPPGDRPTTPWRSESLRSRRPPCPPDASSRRGPLWRRAVAAVAYLGDVAAVLVGDDVDLVLDTERHRDAASTDELAEAEVVHAAQISHRGVLVVVEGFAEEIRDGALLGGGRLYRLMAWLNDASAESRVSSLRTTGCVEMFSKKCKFSLDTSCRLILIAGPGYALYPYAFKYGSSNTTKTPEQKIEGPSYLFSFSRYWA